MKKAPLYPILCGREFGAAALHVPSLLRWAASKGLYLHTEPPIGDYEIMQVEALLCDIERGAKPDNYEEAGILVSCTPELAEHSNDPCSVWLVGAEAHRKWRDLLREAFNAGELQMLDFASLLPLKADEVHVQVASIRKQPARADAEPVTAGAPLSRQRHQENEMLRVLANLGYDPKRLPRPPAGAAGPKSEARAKLSEMSNKVFNKAWERLRSSGDIADAE